MTLPKLDVAGSNPVGRSNNSGSWRAGAQLDRHARSGVPLARFVRERYWPAVAPSWSPRWQAYSKWALDTICDDLGLRPLGTITPEDVERWWGRIRMRYPNAETSSKLLARLKHVFATAQRWGYIVENPALSSKAPRKSKGRVVWFTPEQRALLFEHAHFALRVYLEAAYCTGARRSELIRLTWDDVDLEAGTVTFRGRKNDEDLVLPMTGRLRGVFFALGYMRPRQGYVLPRYRPLSLSQAFKRLMVRLQLPQARMNVAFHALRHDFGSRLGMAGANTRTIMDAGGWRDPRMAARYTHLSREAVRSALEGVS